MYAGKGEEMDSTNHVYKFRSSIFRIFLTDFVEEVNNTSRPVVTVCINGFNTQQFYVLPTQCIYVFCVDLRTNSDYFPIQH